jgi:2-C-methyl-D-erythritol 4-phosphate cytidylyltransferase
MTAEVPLKKYAIIVAGGSGTRMDSLVPKQFMKLDGKPVLMHTITRFSEANLNIDIILVISPAQLENWRQLCVENQFTIPFQIAESGESRFQSVKNGLALIKEDGIVAIHDGARPLVDPKIISTAYKAAEMYGNAVPAIPLNDSIRQIDSTLSIAVDRSKYCIIQTPQCFKTEIIKKAYEQDYKFTFTDDATVVEAMGEKVRLIDGHSDNIKLTNPRDFIIAEALLKNKPAVTPHNKLKLADDLNILNKQEPSSN